MRAFLAEHRSRTISCGIFLLCMVWTCILFTAFYMQFHTTNALEKGICLFLEKTGMEQSKITGYLEKEDDKNLFASYIFKQNTSLDYVYRNEDKLPKTQEKNILRLAGYFAGENAKNPLWSAAGSRFLQNEAYFADDSASTTVLANQDAQNVVGTSKEMDSTETSKQDSVTVSTKEVAVDSKEKVKENMEKISKLEKSLSRSYLLKKFYITDSSTTIDNAVFQVRKLLTKSMVLKKEKKPQILIFHTHGASESFKDSRKGNQEDSIVGVGSVLADVLTKTYGYKVIHDKTEYDRINGKIDRSKAYNYSCEGVKKALQKYPSIEVVIDLHRDGVGNSVNRTTIVDGKKTAQVMFFNGLSRNASGDIKYLHNENLQGNLAFSLQLKIACMKRFENFAKPIYLKGYRYNMHLKERFTLIELGNENNTVAEEKNATRPLAMAIDSVLQGK